MTTTNQYTDNFDQITNKKKSHRTYFSWPRRVSLDFGKNQIANFECVLFAHFYCLLCASFCYFTDNAHNFLTNKKKLNWSCFSLGQRRAPKKTTILSNDVICLDSISSNRWCEKKTLRQIHWWIKCTKCESSMYKKKSGTIVSCVYVYCLDSRCQLWHMTQSSSVKLRCTHQSDVTVFFQWI